MLHHSLDVPGDMFHGPIELEMAHLFIPVHVHMSCFISGSLIFHLLDILWWCSSWTCEYLYDVHAHHDVHMHVTFLVAAILVPFIFTQANVLNRFLKTLAMEEKGQSSWPNLYLP